ncbi:MAG: hypothetical protein C0467_13985 [Planctomycetaceae bacterium]|nr:hypothetical protein [Planctomycetaceae bacterium]
MGWDPVRARAPGEGPREPRLALGLGLDHQVHVNLAWRSGSDWTTTCGLPHHLSIAHFGNAAWSSFNPASVTAINETKENLNGNPEPGRDPYAEKEFPDFE